MKKHVTAGLLVCVWAAAANAQVLDPARPQTGILGMSSLVLPISVQQTETPSAPQLRDVLRQPLDGVQALGGKPYRLSPEERHRLREQLRSQSSAQQDGRKS